MFRHFCTYFCTFSSTIPISSVLILHETMNLNRHKAYFRTKQRLKKVLRNAQQPITWNNALISLTDQKFIFGRYNIEMMMGYLFTSLSPSPLQSTKYHGFELRTTDAIEWWGASLMWQHERQENMYVYAMEAERYTDGSGGVAWIHLFRLERNHPQTMILSSMPLCRLCSSRNTLSYARYVCCQDTRYCSYECQDVDWTHGHYTSHRCL